jgi:hypothetical protein
MVTNIMTMSTVNEFYSRKVLKRIKVMDIAICKRVCCDFL